MISLSAVFLDSWTPRGAGFGLWPNILNWDFTRAVSTIQSEYHIPRIRVYIDIYICIQGDVHI